MECSKPTFRLWMFSVHKSSVMCKNNGLEIDSLQQSMALAYYGRASKTVLSCSNAFERFCG